MKAAKQNWAAFQKDPEWQKVATESQVNGKIVAKVESVFLDATDYSPLKYPRCVLGPLCGLRRELYSLLQPHNGRGGGARRTGTAVRMPMFRWV